MKLALAVGTAAICLALAGCKSPNSRGVASDSDPFSVDLTRVSSYCTISQVTCAPYCMIMPSQGCEGQKGVQAYRCTCPALEAAPPGDKAIIIKAQLMCVAEVSDCPGYCKANATSGQCANNGHPAVECQCPALKIKGE